jgi:hypothetical protein
MMGLSDHGFGWMMASMEERPECLKIGGRVDQWFEGCWGEGGMVCIVSMEKYQLQGPLSVFAYRPTLAWIL